MNTDSGHLKTFLAGFAACAVVVAVFWMNNKVSSVKNLSLPSPPAKELAHERTEVLRCTPLVVYRDASKKALGLPDEVVKSPVQKVVGSTQVPVSDYPHTISAIANIESGKVDMFVRRDKLEWLSFARKGTLGVSWGVQDDGETATRLDASYRLLAVKRLNLGLVGDVSTTGRAFIGGRAWVSF